MITREEVLPIGHTLSPHGLNGELNCIFDDLTFDDVEAEFLVIEIDGILVPFFFESYRFKSENAALIKFEGIDDATTARTLQGKVLYLHERYANEQLRQSVRATNDLLTGYCLIDRTAGNIGTIVHLDQSTENMLFELDNGRLIPANDDLIQHIDDSTRTIYVNLPNGLLEL